MSSPIRRYADLVTQRQFVAALEGRDLPYGRDELLEVLTSCEAREIEIRRLEQISTAWWILTYLSRECLNRPLDAMVVDGKGTVELSGFLVRARLRDRDDLNPGDIVTVRLESVDPEHGSIRLASPE
jgi:exoribonuclease II